MTAEMTLPVLGSNFVVTFAVPNGPEASLHFDFASLLAAFSASDAAPLLNSPRVPAGATGKLDTSCVAEEVPGMDEEDEDEGASWGVGVLASQAVRKAMMARYVEGWCKCELLRAGFAHDALITQGKSTPRGWFFRLDTLRLTHNNSSFSAAPN